MSALFTEQSLLDEFSDVNTRASVARQFRLKIKKVLKREMRLPNGTPNGLTRNEKDFVIGSVILRDLQNIGTDLTLPGSNYMGPGTRFVLNILNDIQPTDKGDEAARLHDFEYLQSDTLKQTRKADTKLTNSIRKVSLTEKSLISVFKDIAAGIAITSKDGLEFALSKIVGDKRADTKFAGTYRVNDEILQELNTFKTIREQGEELKTAKDEEELEEKKEPRKTAVSQPLGNDQPGQESLPISKDAVVDTLKGILNRINEQLAILAPIGKDTTAGKKARQAYATLQGQYIDILKSSNIGASQVNDKLVPEFVTYRDLVTDWHNTQLRLKKKPRRLGRGKEGGVNLSGLSFVDIQSDADIRRLSSDDPKDKPSEIPTFADADSDNADSDDEKGGPDADNSTTGVIETPIEQKTQQQQQQRQSNIKNEQQSDAITLGVPSQAVSRPGIFPRQTLLPIVAGSDVLNVSQKDIKEDAEHFARFSWIQPNVELIKELKDAVSVLYRPLVKYQKIVDANLPKAELLPQEDIVQDFTPVDNDMHFARMFGTRSLKGQLGVPIFQDDDREADNQRLFFPDTVTDIRTRKIFQF